MYHSPRLMPRSRELGQGRIKASTIKPGKQFDNKPKEILVALCSSWVPQRSRGVSKSVKVARPPVHTASIPFILFLRSKAWQKSRKVSLPGGDLHLRADDDGGNLRRKPEAFYVGPNGLPTHFQHGHVVAPTIGRHWRRPPARHTGGGPGAHDLHGKGGRISLDPVPDPESALWWRSATATEGARGAAGP